MLPQRTMRSCSIDGCPRRHCAGGLCRTHSMQWRRTGTPEPVFGQHTVWNKGVPMSPETRAKLAESKRTTMTDDVRAKIKAARARQVMTPDRNAKVAASNRGKRRSAEQIARGSGPNSVHWKGGGGRNLGRTAWRRLRQEVLERDGHACRECTGSTGLVAHHIVHHDCGGPDTLDNLLTLCRPCHLRIHPPTRHGLVSS